MEPIAQAAAGGLTEGTLATLLERQGAVLGEEQPRPDYGRSCPIGRRERPLRAKGAELQQSEPIGPCPACRRDFFPPTADPASGQAGL
jgi:hypothetical protein